MTTEVVAYVRRNAIEVPLTQRVRDHLPQYTYKPPIDRYLVERYGIPDTRPIPRFRIAGDKVLIPIFLAHTLRQLRLVDRFVVVEDTLARPFPNQAVYSGIPRQDFYEYQWEAAEWLLRNNFNNERMRNHTASCVLEMGVGTGKSYLATLLMLLLRMRTLLIVHRKKLREQWIKDVFSRKCPGLRVGDDPTDEDADIVIMIVNSAVDAARTAQDYAGFGFVIYDEVPKMCTSRFAEVFWLTRTRYGLCMSGDIDDRDDGGDIVYHDHHGTTVTEDMMGIAKKIYSFDVVVEVAMVRVPDQYLNAERSGKGMRNIMREIAKLNKCEAYRDFIVERTRRMVAEGYNTYVFCHNRATVDYYAARLRESDESIFTMMSGQDESEDMLEEDEETRGAYAVSCKRGAVIVATYAYGAVGVSITRMTGLVYADPPFNKPLKQCIGRILRPGPEQTQPRMIVDVVIAGSHFAKKYNSDRAGYYARRHFTVMGRDYTGTTSPPGKGFTWQGGTAGQTPVLLIKS